MNVSVEKRRFRRTRQPIPVKIGSGPRAVWEWVENISRGGAYIKGPRRAARGDCLELSFLFPGLKDPILLPCRVVRQDAAGIGVHFIPYPVGAS